MTSTLAESHPSELISLGYEIKDGVWFLKHARCILHPERSLSFNGRTTRLLVQGFFEDRELLAITKECIRIQRYRCPKCKRERPNSEIEGITRIVNHSREIYESRLKRYLINFAVENGVKATMSLCISLDHVISRSTIYKWLKEERN